MYDSEYKSISKGDSYAQKNLNKKMSRRDYEMFCSDGLLVGPQARKLSQIEPTINNSMSLETSSIVYHDQSLVDLTGATATDYQSPMN